MSIQLTESPATFQLKGGLYPLTALQLLSGNLKAFSEQLETKIAQAPKFFFNAPVVIDLQKWRSEKELDFKLLRDILISKYLVPVGVKGGTHEQHAAAVKAQLAILSEGTKEKEREKDKVDTIKEASIDAIKESSSEKIKAKDSKKSSDQETENPEESEIQGSLTKVITEPVRSGQQIYVRGGDLIVLAPVSHGSELLADGNIHVYGPLRGRALAGVTGDTGTHIFCQSLEAELISVAGQYKIAEDIEQACWRNGADIYLEGGRLQIRPL